MKTLVLIASLTTACATAFAFPDYDSFSYSPGDLIGNGGWSDAGVGGAAAGPDIVAGGLSYPGLASSGGTSVAFGVGTENARMVLSANQVPPSGGNLSVFFSYELQLTSAGSTGPFQLTALDQRTTGTIGSRGAAVMVQDNGLGTGFYIGMMRGGQTGSTSSGQHEINWVGGTIGDPTGGTLFSYDTTHFVVGAYNFINPAKNDTDPKSNNDTADLWVNPDASTFSNVSAPAASAQNIGDDGAAVTDLANIASLDLIQNGTGAAAGQLDDLRIGTSWAEVTPVPEPSTVVLGILGVAGLFASSRFRKSA